jgi:hypothetical protein
MKSMSVFILSAVMAITAPVALAKYPYESSSPNDNKLKGEQLGAIGLNPEGASAYILDDTNQFGWTAEVTLPPKPNVYGSAVLVSNYSAQPVSVNTAYTALSAKYAITQHHGVWFAFDPAAGKWNVMSDNPFTPGNPSGRVDIAPAGQ